MNRIEIIENLLMRRDEDLETAFTNLDKVFQRLEKTEKITINVSQKGVLYAETLFREVGLFK